MHYTCRNVEAIYVGILENLYTLDQKRIRRLSRIVGKLNVPTSHTKPVCFWR